MIYTSENIYIRRTHQKYAVIYFSLEFNNFGFSAECGLVKCSIVKCLHGSRTNDDTKVLVDWT